MNKYSHVCVLKGGWSNEREISLLSGTAIANGLKQVGYEVTEVDVDKNIASVLKRLSPDAVFNALHGTWGEDGCVQGLLEIMNIPYTHSGVRSSALAMNKIMSKVVKNVYKNINLILLVTLVGIIILLITGFGCMAPKLKPLSQETKEEFKIYNDSELKNIKYKLVIIKLF